MASSNKPAHIFDIESAESLFGLIKVCHSEFSRGATRRTQDLLFLIFGLTHLREWIAPAYSPGSANERPPKNDAERFSLALEDSSAFKLIKALCNRSKHMRKDVVTGALRQRNPIDTWKDVDSVLDFDRGAPVAYFVDGHDVDELIRTLIAQYESDWFSRCGHRP